MSEKRRSKIKDRRSENRSSLTSSPFFVIARRNDEAISDWWGSSQFHFHAKTISLLSQCNEIAALHYVPLAMTNLENLQPATSNLQLLLIFNLQSSIFNSPYAP